MNVPGQVPRVIVAGVLLFLATADARAQRYTCPPPEWSLIQLEALKRDDFKIANSSRRHELALALPDCLGHSNPEVRDGIAFEALSVWMRGGQLDEATLRALRSDLLTMVGTPDADGFRAPFAVLVLSEVARTDRLTPWMTAEERDELVRTGALYLAKLNDYRAFNDKEGFRHGVAHGADLALQLALNPQTTKAQLDHLMLAVASQVSPTANVAYWAGEPDRLARAIVFTAQRQLHTAAEWSGFFAEIADPRPLKSWGQAFASEIGIRKRHNVRAFLLSVYASATSSDDPGIRALAAPVTAALKAVP